MKKTVLILLLSAAVSLTAQNKVSLPELNMEYELPGSWETVPFFKEDWEMPGGNNLCQCAGVLNSFKIPGGEDFDYMYMAAYPSDRKHANTAPRQGVWQYKFVPVEETDTVRTGNLVWEKKVSKLKPEGSSNNRFKDYTVYKYTSHFGSTYYTMYIWAKPYILQQYATKIDGIVASFKAVK